MDQKIKANQVGAARVLLDITQMQLAELSGISPSTVKRIEAGLGVTRANHAAVVAALEKAGVEFTNDDESGVKLKAKGKRK